VADYSEFPTTPTGWQERQLEDWQTITPLTTEDVVEQRRSPDLVALIPGIFFIGLAIVVMAGATLPAVFQNGGILWLVLIGAGVAMLISERRKARRGR
jgi:hypothetical protein